MLTGLNAAELTWGTKAMNEKKSMLVTSILIGLILATPLIFDFNEEEQEHEVDKKKVEFQVKLVTPDVSDAFVVKENFEKAKRVMDGYSEMKQTIDDLEFPTETMVLTSLGSYYITGYTSLECGGSTMTASGKTVHKSSYEDRLKEPTTCAIDPKLHDFGDLFYVGEPFDSIYVAEDTGSAVKGKHLDLYFFDDEYGQALAATGYYEVFSVEYVYGTVKANEYDVVSLVVKEMME